MRSLVSSIAIIAIGILAALPFRKTFDGVEDIAALEPPQSAYASPLKEIEGEIPDDLPLQEFPAVKAGPAVPAEADAASQAMPALPTTRRPFVQRLAEPTPIVEPSPSWQPAVSDIADVGDWKPGLPLSREIDADSAAPATAIAKADVSATPRPPTALVEEGTAPSMRMQQAGMRNQVTGQPAEPAVPEKPKPRRRYFIHEPAN